MPDATSSPALADILPPDRLAMRSELEKLALYVGKGNTVTMEDVHAAVQDAGAAELDDLVFAVGGGEAKRAAQLIDRLFAEQTAPVAYFTRRAAAFHAFAMGAGANGSRARRNQSGRNGCNRPFSGNMKCAMAFATAPLATQPGGNGPAPPL